MRYKLILQVTNQDTGESIFDLNLSDILATSSLFKTASELYGQVAAVTPLDPNTPFAGA